MHSVLEIPWKWIKVQTLQSVQLTRFLRFEISYYSTISNENAWIVPILQKIKISVFKFPLDIRRFVESRLSTVVWVEEKRENGKKSKRR